MVKEFRPAHFLDGEKGECSALVILNQPISNASLFYKAWDHSIVRSCADGAADQLFRFFKEDEDLRRKHLPDFIAGDMDSLSIETKSYYEALGVPVIKDPDQYSTDFMKVTSILKEQYPEIKDLLVLGAMGGRVDQSFSSIHQLFLLQPALERPVYLLSDESVTFLLEKGTSLIRTPLKHLGKTCGILPIVGTAHITIRGMEWDVTDWETNYGTKVSTSNHLIQDTVEITTDVPVLFTAELREK
ncbi:thiamine pyrophosphokinase [Trichomonascus vanleenenianus]|uniref:thiamine diphosphokinase n=1 Tax=Trichomonascus vanleenenianus TaxID=2268995 RepID=UPI003ECA4182